jgi:hypothetical protein
LEEIKEIPLDIKSEQIIKLPKGSKLLSVVSKSNEPILSVRLNQESNEEEVFTLKSYGGGNDDCLKPYNYTFYEEGKYVGTYNVSKKLKPMVGHVFFVKTKDVIHNLNPTPIKTIASTKKVEYTKTNTIKPYEFDKPSWLKY